jgi:predicted DNA-binding transcriptional regulator AlpA
MAHETPSSQTLAEKDTARYIGMSSAYLRVARRENRGPAFVRVGRTVRYLRADLDAWLIGHRVETRESRVQTNAPGRGNGSRA